MLADVPPIARSKKALLTKRIHIEVKDAEPLVLAIYTMAWAPVAWSQSVDIAHMEIVCKEFQIALDHPNHCPVAASKILTSILPFSGSRSIPVPDVIKFWPAPLMQRSQTPYNSPPSILHCVFRNTWFEN